MSANTSSALAANSARGTWTSFISANPSASSSLTARRDHGRRIAPCMRPRRDAPTPWADPDPNIFALADFLAGDIQSGGIAVGDAERKVVVNGVDFFGQDAWQITRRFNLNWGLRWDYFGPLHNGTKDLAVFNASAVPSRSRGTGSTASSLLTRTTSPRGWVSAYQPTSREDLVVRGGIGVFYDQINMIPFWTSVRQTMLTGLRTIQLARTRFRPTVDRHAMAAWRGFVPGVSTCTTGNVATDPNCGTSIYDVFSVNQNFRTPYFFNYNLNVQKSFGNGMAVWQVGYVGSEGRKLSIMLNINQFGQLTPQFPTSAASTNLTASVLPTTTHCRAHCG